MLGNLFSRSIAMMADFGFAALPRRNSPRNPTQPRRLRGRGGSARHRHSYLPYVKGVPGAKLAKKAALGRLGLRQPGTPIHTR